MRPVRLFGVLVVAILAATTAGAAGFFRVVERDGRHWLLDPAGREFLSTGVNVFHTGSDPVSFDPDNPEYSALRLHPSVEAWCASARSRLAAWGFNTLGAWAEPSAVSCARLPYTVCLDLGVWVGAPWADLASPEAQAEIRALIAREVLPRREDPQLIGYFLDNELRWYGPALFHYWALEGSEERLKRALYALLVEQYHDDLVALLQDFSIAPAPRRFADLAGALSEVEVRPGRRPAVIDRFVALLADEYYRTLAEAVRAADPNHLLLGDRYASSYSQAVARASARYMDVVSANYAGTEGGGWVSPSFFDTLHRVTGKPLLVTEVYAAAEENRSGNGNRGGPYLVVGTQRERAATVEGMVTQLARLPYVVGYHWFQWSDQPRTGREDGEDFNMGLVDLEDRPYEEVTAAFTRVNGRIPDLHREGPPSQGLTRVESAWVVPRGALAADGRLHDWDLPRHWLPGAVASEPDLPFGDFYLAWEPAGLWLGVSYQDFGLATPSPAIPQSRRRLEVSVGGDGGASRSILVVGFGDRREGALVPLVAEGPPDTPGVGIRGAQHARNLLTTAEVLLPAAVFGRERLHAGQTVSLRVVLSMEGAERRLMWPERTPAVLRLGVDRE